MDKAGRGGGPVDNTAEPEDPHNHADCARGSEEGETPACQSCRKRKLKCSRETPICSQCARLKCHCLYDRKKLKPGIKTGAVEQLNQRLEFLEKILLDSDGNQKPLAALDSNQGCLYHAALLLARGFQSNGDQLRGYLPSGGILSTDQATLNCGEDSSVAPPRSKPSTSDKVSHKRKRDESFLDQTWDSVDQDNIFSALPSTPILNAIVEAYFERINYWIPFLHPPRFTAAVRSQQLQPEHGIILHAILSSTMKYLKRDRYNLTQSEIDRQVRFSRNVVMLKAMDSLTIEGIQALIIVAFDYIGSGQVSKAWPIIGSLTRTVEYLQLTIEPDTMQQYSLSAPLSLLNAPSDWTETEDRRRVFWNVFLLDRFCSVSTGWNTSLTSDDVRRRLPCDWGLWHREEAVVTPYFGIWNKAAAKIGNSVAYIPAHYPNPDHAVDHSSPDGVTNLGPVDTSKLGAFAYCIEATESLSQITSFFLQQRVNLRSSKEVTSWLTRFKELDLRLVHWKMFLPQKWKDTNISRDSALVNMDPNLTLAHITHNTSMILLHQHIAYPPPQLTQMIELPSSCSAETCRLAAVETASISQKYLKHTKFGVVNSQFALCAFVAARILLVRWRFSGAELLPEFFHLIESLDTMSTLWRGESNVGDDNPNASELDLAGMYALHLRSLHQKCLSSPHFRMGPSYGVLLPPLAVPKWSTTWQFVSSPFQHNAVESDSPRTVNFEAQRRPSERHNFPSQQQPRHSDQAFMFDPSSMQAEMPVEPSVQSPSSTYNPQPSQNLLQHNNNTSFFSRSPTDFAHMNGRTNIGHGSLSHGSETIDELTEMSNVLLGQQFLEMDRVISLDDTDFALNLDIWGYGA